MDISQTVGVAASFEGARNAGIQQATTTANTDDVQRDTKKQSQDLDLKHTDTVSGNSGSNGSSGANGNNGHKVNVLV